MCGRYSLYASRAKLKEQFQIARDLAPDSLFGRYNIAPSQPVATVRIAQDGVRELVPLRWGLIPHWAKEAKLEYSTINARAETAAEKPAFRSAFRYRRCLIPANGFYEWQARPQANLKQPWYIQRQDGEVFAFAGLWERWQSQAEVIESCTILVTDANELLRPIHDRMPVILDPSDYELWLDPFQHDLQALKSLLKPYPAWRLSARKVGLRVNNPKNDDPACLEPAALN
ncbi:MAG: SOS response-associated peptidase [Methylohalobius sp.]|nr:SOS response-associated peptidase [Methylohalobius sp.]